VAASSGGIDVSFNLISLGDVQGTPLAQMPLEDFEWPIMTAVRSQFLTSRAAARHMMRQGSGVILFFGGEGDPLPDYYIGGFQVALSAIEFLRRQLASELAPDTRVCLAGLLREQDLSDAWAGCVQESTGYALLGARTKVRFNSFCIRPT